MYLSTNSSVQQSLGQYLLGIEDSSLAPSKNHKKSRRFAQKIIPPPNPYTFFGSLSVWLKDVHLEAGNGNR